MLATRVAFSRHLLPMLLSVPVAWYQADRTAVPHTVCTGVWTFCMLLGRGGRRHVVTTVFAMLDSRPQGPDSPVERAAWTALRDALLTFLGRHAAELCDVVPGAVADADAAATCRTILVRLLVSGIMEGSSVCATLHPAV
jgi:hypothetical protein